MYLYVDRDRVCKCDCLHEKKNGECTVARYVVIRYLVNRPSGKPVKTYISSNILACWLMSSERDSINTVRHACGKEIASVICLRIHVCTYSVHVVTPEKLG